MNQKSSLRLINGQLANSYYHFNKIIDNKPKQNKKNMLNNQCEWNPVKRMLI